MIVTVTPNPAWDVTIDLDRVALGETNVVGDCRRRAGGKGINVARVLHFRSVPVLAVAPVGQADGAAFAADLDMPHRLVATSLPLRHTFAVVEADPGVTTMLTARGGARSEEDHRRLAATVDELAPVASCLVISGSLPPRSAVAVSAGLIDAAHRHGVPVIADLAGAHMLAAAEAGADVLKPNRDELAEAVGITDPVAGARELQGRGAGTVVVSLGEEGLVVVPADPNATIWRARLPQPLRGNPTGAGDAAVAAIAGLIHSGDDDHAHWARRAVAWSAAAVLSPLAGDVDPSADLLAERVELSAL